ncbi:MAG TPA: hypothetical protein VMX14_03620 [Anaerolineae bacterium]|nr:hypothetical protein [Anaerolineae bacterium]
MPKAMKGLIVLLVVVAIFGSIFAAFCMGGERSVLNGLLADGYDVVIDPLCRVGEGRYAVRTWQRGVGWTLVER